MKHIEYSLSNQDIEVILFTLSVLPSLGLESSETQSEINYLNCLSAGKKLISRSTNFSPNELRVICASLRAALCISRHEFKTDAETLKKCNDYFFSINRLSSVFDL